MLPLEAELRKEIYRLEDLRRYVDSDGERRNLTRQIHQLMIRLDLLTRRSFSLSGAQFYGRKLRRKFSSR